MPAAVAKYYQPHPQMRSLMANRTRLHRERRTAQRIPETECGPRNLTRRRGFDYSMFIDSMWI
jgi:hypothetical protein